jgi:hypothetical protein
LLIPLPTTRSALADDNTEDLPSVTLAPSAALSYLQMPLSLRSVMLMCIWMVLSNMGRYFGEQLDQVMSKYHLPQAQGVVVLSTSMQT